MDHLPVPPSLPRSASARAGAGPVLSVLSVLSVLWMLVGAVVPGAAPASAGGVSGGVDDPACTPDPRMPVDGRASPYDSAHVALAGGVVKLCFGSPALRGRTMLGGGEVPFGRLWRFGANEPTTLHTSVPLSVGGIQLPPGSVAMYAIPDAERWEIFVTGSTDHWGLRITPEVRDQELGSFHVVPEVLEEPVESLTFRFEEAGVRSAALVMEWQTTRLVLPVTVTGG